jgi:tetratricopeptide (TPR) repeat protein
MLGNLGNMYSALRESRQAIYYYEQALAVAREIGDRMAEALTSFNLAVLCVQIQQPQSARTHAEAATRLFHEIGHAEYAGRADQLLNQLRSTSR